MQASGYRRVVAKEFGEPKVLEIEQVTTLPEPAPDEVLVRVEAAGVGFTDTIVRRGKYRGYTGGLPLTPGYDLAGTVAAVGSEVSGWVVGDRVADMPISGAYAQYLLRKAETLVRIPDGVAPETAVDVPLMWVTAWQMLTRVASLEPGDTVLVVGASGAVGRPLVQLARHLELKVIGTASKGKLGLVEALGATALDYGRSDLAAAIRAEGPVNAAFDAVGGESWETSWAALAPDGLLVGYGLQAFVDSDAPAAEAVSMLTRFHVDMLKEGAMDGTNRATSFYDISERRGTHPGDYLADAGHLLDLIARGTIEPLEPELLPLEAAAEAHCRVASGQLRHRLVLRP